MEALDLTGLDRGLAHDVGRGRSDKLLSCVQCGTCSASCPAGRFMDPSPRQLWRMLQLGLTDEALRSRTIWFCSLCYECQVRCPRGIRLTEAITRLKELALGSGAAPLRASKTFYEVFGHVMRQYGRVRELELMVRFFLRWNPLASLSQAKLGVRLLTRGKVRTEVPRLVGEGRLDRLFERVAELEREG